MKSTINKVLLGFTFIMLFWSCGKVTNGSGFVPDQSLKKPNPSTTSPTDEPFVHPGVLNTSATLDLIATQVDRSDPTRVAAYKKVTDYINARSYPTSFHSIVYVGSNGRTSPSKSQIRNDAILAYAYALRFAQTANPADADKAIGILNGWASSFYKYEILDKSIDNANQPSLEASWTTPSFVAAAEIIRYYKPKGISANWAKEDIKMFSDYLINVKTYIDKTPNYKNNWNVSAGYALMAIGVFLNSPNIYESGKTTLNNILPLTIQSDGTLPELCDRQDCVHYQYSLTGLTYGSEIAAIQGDNSLYTALSSRISLGYDYMRKAYNRTTPCIYCSNSSPVFPGTEVAFKHYNTSNLQALRDLQAPLGVPNDNTFLGFTTYTHYKVK